MARSKYSDRFLVTFHISDVEKIKALAEAERKPAATLIREIVLCQLRKYKAA